MGIFKFITDKGKELLGGKKDPAKAIKEEVRDLGLDDGLGRDFEIVVEGETVKLKGTAPDQETKEKIILAAGNVQGIGAVDDQMDASETTFYTVKSGDSLSKIAKKYYGNARLYPEIFEANRPMLSHPDKIYPGQVLRIPGTSKA
ncbi:MAG: peptidoglycan-binding protein LysM [Pseudomonadota bacterium]